MKFAKKRLFFSAILIATLVPSVIWVYRQVQYSTHKTPTIKTATVTVNKGGTLVTRDGSSSTSSTQTTDTIAAAPSKSATYTSNTTTVSNRPNAAILSWKQQGTTGVSVEVRTRNGNTWSEWTKTTEDNTDGKDSVDSSTSGTVSTIILAKRIDDIQYRFTLSGTQTAASASIDPSSVSIRSIDSNDGPKQTQASVLNKLFSSLSLFQSASAMQANPRIISRAEWGCPQPNYSEWTPEYHDLGRAIIHHTATTEATDSYASVRAIWQYHTYSNGWGDIGYNYLVDSSGNIFQGRYYDQNYATNNHVDVIGGHAYGNNTGTTGIAAIGDFIRSQPTGAQLNSIAQIIGYKLAPYSIDPSGNGGYGPAVIGHYQVWQTSCPGANMINQFPYIKSLASQYYQSYNQQYRYDYSYSGQQLFVNGSAVSSSTQVSPTDTVEVAIYLKNEGDETWSSTSNPVLLGTTSLSNRTSTFYDSQTWTSTNRSASFEGVLQSDGSIQKTTSISKGQIASFRIKLKIPTIYSTSASDDSQTFDEHFTPMIEGVLWFPRDIGLYQPIAVKKSVLDYTYAGQGIFTDAGLTSAAPAQLSPDTDYYLSLSLKNSGTIAWDKSLRIGTSSPTDRSSNLFTDNWISSNRATSLNETSVAPGETGTFTMKIHTPSTSSDTIQKEYFRPVVDGIAWLKDCGIYYTIDTKKAVYDWQYVAQGSYTDASTATPVDVSAQPLGTRYYVSLTIKNTGTLALPAHQFRLGTSSPTDRTSKFYESSWIGPNRPAELTNSVQPGDNGSIGFWVTKSSNTAQKEYFRPVIEGKEWLRDVGLHWQM